MKMKEEHYSYIKKEVTNNFSKEWVNQYSLDILKEYNEKFKTKEQVNQRVRMDLLYMAGLTNWICATLYPYLTDKHINTAMYKLMQDCYPHAIR